MIKIYERQSHMVIEDCCSGPSIEFFYTRLGSLFSIGRSYNNHLDVYQESFSEFTRENDSTFSSADEFENYLLGIINSIDKENKINRNTVSTTMNSSAYQWNGNTDSGPMEYILPAGIQNLAFRIVNTGKSGNSLTITPDGSDNLLGVNSSLELSDGESLIIGYDSTDGWY